MPYMELFVLKLHQHAPCFSISEKAYCGGQTNTLFSDLDEEFGAKRTVLDKS